MKNSDTPTNDEHLIIQIISDDYKEHQSNHYSSIWGKEIYPVAFNPIEENRGRAKYDFRKNNRYKMMGYKMKTEDTHTCKYCKFMKITIIPPSTKQYCTTHNKYVELNGDCKHYIYDETLPVKYEKYGEII